MFLLLSIYLSIHLLLIDHYGLSWDFHHHFFSGLYMLRQKITPELLDRLPFTEPYPITSVQLPFGPLMTIAPVLTYLLFFQELKILAFDNAYNLAIILSGVCGVLVLYLFLREAAGRRIGAIAAIILALYPRFFGDMHNNMKDVPQAACFTLAVWMYWRLANYRRVRDVIFAALAYAVAFNMKINTVFMPVVALAWSLFLILTKTGKRLAVSLPKITIRALLPFLFYCLLSLAFAITIWWPFWDDPWERLMYIPKFFSLNTVNIEVVYFGHWFCSSQNVPWHYPLGYLLAVTPLGVTLVFLVGLAVLFHGVIKKQPLPSLLLFWFLVPLLRYFSPKTGVMDGIRHFQEVIYPLAAIAALGTDGILTLLSQTKSKISYSKLFIILGIGYLVFLNIKYHPYQISYFSELVGGIKGALGRFDIDYWGSSQKQAILWLNENAPENAVIHVVMMPDVSAKYLRPDLLARVNTRGYDESDYVVVLNRQSFFYRYFYLWEYFLRRRTAFIVENQGVPLTWVYDNHLTGTIRRPNWWQGESSCLKKYWR
jgi:hypothetical protein